MNDPRVNIEEEKNSSLSVIPETSEDKDIYNYEEEDQCSLSQCNS